jgi:hypothetical protein
MSYSVQSAFLSDLIYSSARVNQGAADTKARYVAPNGAVWEIKAFSEVSGGYLLGGIRFYSTHGSITV